MSGTFLKKKKTDQRRKRFEDEALVHTDALYAMALRLTRNERDADDLLQDALVRAFRFFDSYREGSNIRAWLFRIVTNTFYNSIRKSRNISRLESEAESGWHYERFVSMASASGRSAEDMLLDATSSEHLTVAVGALAEDFRAVVLLCDVHGFSYKEIAEIVDCPVGTVMSRLHRGRRQLQKALYDHAIERGIIAAPASAEVTDSKRAPHAPEVSDATDIPGDSDSKPSDLQEFRDRKAARR